MRGPDADRRAKLLIHLAVEGALLGAYSQAAENSDTDASRKWVDELSSYVDGVECISN